MFKKKSKSTATVAPDAPDAAPEGSAAGSAPEKSVAERAKEAREAALAHLAATEEEEARVDAERTARIEASRARTEAHKRKSMAANQEAQAAKQAAAKHREGADEADRAAADRRAKETSAAASPEAERSYSHKTRKWWRLPNLFRKISSRSSKSLVRKQNSPASSTAEGEEGAPPLVKEPSLLQRARQARQSLVASLGMSRGSSIDKPKTPKREKSAGREGESVLERARRKRQEAAARLEEMEAKEQQQKK